jgi:hypothetical protein
LGKCGTTGATLSYGLWVLADTGNKKIIHHNGSMTPWYVQSTPGSYPYNVTYFIVGVYDSSAGKSRLYVNGTKFEVSVTGTVVDDGDFAIGNVGSFSEWDSYFSGPVDDVKVRDTAVSDDWVITEYNNQSSPATFITEGTEEDVGSTSVTITPDALALTSVVNDGTISTVRNITTILSVQSLTSSVPTPTINTTITTTANNVIYMANRDRIAIKLNDSGTVYLELD